MKNITEADYDEAKQAAMRILEADLGTLPENLAKILRAGIKTGPNAPIIAAWCKEHPAETARIVGAMAMVLATKP